jgi:hypothetical protein
MTVDSTAITALMQSIQERLGRVEQTLSGPGDSIDRLVTQSRAQVQQLAKLPEELNRIENRTILLEGRVEALEERVKRARTNLHLRELIALVDRVPGGWRTILIAWGGATAAIDVGLDLVGISRILKNFLGL